MTRPHSAAAARAGTASRTAAGALSGEPAAEGRPRIVFEAELDRLGRLASGDPGSDAQRNLDPCRPLRNGASRVALSS